MTYFCLLFIITAESVGEPKLGQAAVAETVLNRVYDDEFPNDVCSVIFEKNQFSPATNPSAFVPTESTIDIATRYLNYLERGVNTNITNGSMWFRANYVKKSFHDGLNPMITIGNHTFFSLPVLEKPNAAN